MYHVSFDDRMSNDMQLNLSACCEIFICTVLNLSIPTPTIWMASQAPAVVLVIPERTHKPRKGCQYNEEERAVLSKHKAEYKSKTTPAEREEVVRNKILVDIFNYWYDKEKIMPSEVLFQQRIQVLFFVSIVIHLQ